MPDTITTHTIRALTLLVLLLTPTTRAQSDIPALARTIGNATNRAVLDLSGQWRAIIDPYDTGSLGYKSTPRTDGYWMDARPASPLDLVEYDFDNAMTLHVPGDFNTQRPELFLYEGTVWYRTTFTLDPKPDHRYFVRVAGANRRSLVALNAQRLGTNPVGFTPKSYEITQLVQSPGKQHSLVIRTDNTRDPAGVPAMLTDWWNYGGLTRPVHIIETPNTFIRDTHASLDPDGQTASGWIALDGPASTNATLKIKLADQTTQATTNDQGIAHWSIDASTLKRWNPGAPVLHDLRVDLMDADNNSLDTFTDRIGLRTVTTNAGQILVNDKPVLLRGISVHEEQISGDGRSWSQAHARELITHLQALNCNFVRLAHYPHAEIVSRIMDEAGIMVWSEIPVYWTLDYDNPETLDQARTHIDSLIGRDHNRASVIIWSIGNETGTSDEITAFRNAIADRVRQLDPSRLLAAALEARLTVEDGHVTKLVLDDPFAKSVDVYAINSYIGWYVGKANDMRTLPIETADPKPFMVSEFGAGALRGNHEKPGLGDQLWTEQYQARIYKETLAWIENAPNFAGATPWILADFRSPRRVLADVQDWWNRKGLLDEQGNPKQAHEVLKQTYKRWEQQHP